MSITQNTNAEQLEQLIEGLEILKAEIEWEHSLEYQILIDKVIDVLRRDI